ncbi:hypothetical protein [Bacteroides sp.]
MRKLQSLILVLMCLLVQHAFAEPITKPEMGKAYLITHSSGYLLSIDGTKFKIMSPGTCDMQKFEFVPVEGEADVYNIKECSTGQFVASDGEYTPILAEDATVDMAKFRLVAAYDDYVKLQNVGMFAQSAAIACFGTDSNNESSSIWSNKEGLDGKHYWTLNEAPDGAITVALENAVKNAEVALADATIGEGTGEYPQSAADALTAAIAAAKVALTSDDQTTINAAVLTLNDAVAVFYASQKIMDVDPEKQYCFIHYPSSLLLTLTGSTATIEEPTGADNQKFRLIQVEGMQSLYNIQLSNGSYLARDGWRILTGTDPTSEKARFVAELVDANEGILRFKEYQTGPGYLGTDEVKAGSGVYGNKGNVDNSWWTLKEVVEGLLIKEPLEKAIADAGQLVADAVVGTEPGNFEQEAVDVLNAAIVTAQEALNATEQSEINDAALALNDAIALFKAQRIVISVDPEKQYYLFHSPSDLVLGINSSNEADIENPAGADNQKFKLVAVTGTKSIYNLQLANGSYLIRKGGWNTTVGTDPEADVAKFEFELADLTQGLVRLKKYNEGGYFGTDDNKAGSLVYTNKQNIDRSWWSLKEVVPGELITVALDKALLKAQQLVDGAVIGDKLGNYSQEAVDALANAINTAQDLEESATTQDEITVAVTDLNAAISKFQASQIFLVPGSKYRIQGRKRSGFFNVVEGSIAQVASMTSGNTGEHFDFIQNTDGSYFIKSGDSYVGTDFALTNSEVKWILNYEATAANIKYYNILQADDATKCMGDNSGQSWNIQTFQANNTALQFRFVRVDEANDPNRIALENAIASARNTLDNIDRGDEIGKWNDRKCDAFEAVIKEAEELNGITQEEVNAMVAKLQNAERDFKNNPNSVIKDELEALLDAAREKAAAAVVGIEIGEFFQTAINGFEAQIAEYQDKANKVSEQAECDALTEEYKLIVEAFVGHTEKQTVKAVLDDAIQSAEALYEAEKDNVGTDKGQRLQAVVDAFKAAIDAAKAVANPAIGDLNTLQNARENFLDGVITVDRKALRTAIAAAGGEDYQNLVAGNFDGQYPQEVITVFNEALVAAKEAETDMSKTQAEVTACTKALNDAMKALKSSKVVIKFTQLDAALALAQPALVSVTVIGDAEGQCPQSVIDALKVVIDETKAIDRAAIAQTGVDAMVEKLDAAVATFKTDLIASTGLQAAIDAAQTQLDATVEGFKPGNYPVTARTQFRKAIEAAQAVIDADEISQADLLAAVEALKVAATKFESGVIAPNDLTDLNAAIADVDAFIVQHGDGFTALNIALAKAKAVVANPNDYAKSDVTKILDDLKKALKAAQLTVGIQDTKLTSLVIYNVDGILFIEGLDGKCRISVYTVNGKSVSSVETSENVYSTSVPGAGTYIVTVKGENIAGSRVVVIK